MKSGLKMIMGIGLGAVLLQLPARAEDKPALTDPKEKMSYSIGMNWGNQLKRGGVEIDVDVISAAIKDVLAGRELKLTDQQAQEAITGYSTQARVKQEEERRKLAEKNHKEGEAFLAENRKKPGVKTQTVKLADGSEAEMQYKIITEGTGPAPKSNDMVNVNYRGTLVNGKEFENSAKRPQAAKLNVGHDFVRGRGEALQMMKMGSKWEIYLPSSLGYGDRFGPNVEPGSALIFELELLGVDTPQPLTSDIIRVPSAEELKAGAKIEVLKPEDVEKAKAGTNKSEKTP